MDLSHRAQEIRLRVSDALRRSGREGESVTIVGVTKTFGPEMVAAVLAAGIADIGENRVQEALEKKPRVGDAARWHLIGHLQRNKAGKAVGEFELIHSIDSLRLAEALSRIGGERGLTTNGLVQINTTEESAKSGISLTDAAEVIPQIVALPNLKIIGLMTMGPVTQDPEDTRRCFRALRELRDRLVDVGLSLPELSMGMSGDFEIAVEEGATIIRVGRTLTGERPPLRG